MVSKDRTDAVLTNDVLTLVSVGMVIAYVSVRDAPGASAGDGASCQRMALCVPLPEKDGWSGSPGSVQAPPSLTAEMSAHVIPVGSTSHTSGESMSTALRFASVPSLWTSTRNVTTSPPRTCTLSVSGGLAGPPLTFATPLTTEIGGGAAIRRSTASRWETVPAEVA